MQTLAVTHRRPTIAPLWLAWMAVAAVGLSVLLAALPLRWALVLAAAVLGGLALVRWPALGLCLLGVAVPFGSLYEFSLGGLTVGPSELLLAVTLASFLVRGMAFRNLPGAPSRLWLPLALYVLWAALSLLRAAWLPTALKELAKWIELGLLLWMAASLAERRWRLWLAVGLLVGGALQALLGIRQFLLGIGPEGFLLLGRYMRAYGTFQQPNPYGGYLGLVLPLAYGLVIAAARPALRDHERGALALLLLAGVSGILMATALVMSWSRGALLGAVAGGALVVLWLVRRSAWAIPALLLVVVIAVPLANRLLPGGYLGRLAGQTAYLGQDLSQVEIDDDNFSPIERLAHWEAAWRMFSRHPYGGVGLGQYAVVYPEVALPRWSDPLGHAHNYYLHVLAELGLVGLTLFLVLCVAVPVVLWRCLRTLSGVERGLGLGALGMWGHLLAHSLVDNLFVHELYLLMALLIGITLAAAASCKEPLL
ncbi:MAG: O-antigen ligase family protein [Anaerolineales bacterium]